MSLVKGQGGLGRILEEQVKPRPYYKLYVKPERADLKVSVLLNRLRGSQFEAELVREGSLKNWISLGDFDSQQEVERIKDRLVKYDVDFSVLKRSRDYLQFWVVLNPGAETVVQGKLKALLLEKYPEIIHQQKVCKPVALVK